MQVETFELNNIANIPEWVNDCLYADDANNEQLQSHLLLTQLDAVANVLVMYKIFNSKVDAVTALTVHGFKVFNCEKATVVEIGKRKFIKLDK